MTSKRFIWKTISWFFATIGILLVTLVLVVTGFYVYYKYFWQDWPSSRIERITGIEVPKCKRNYAFPGVYHDCCTFEFKTIPSEKLFEEIDKKIAFGDTLWKRDGDTYTFYKSWGHGIPAPKGEEKERNGSFQMTIKRGVPDVSIRYGHKYKGH